MTARRHVVIAVLVTFVASMLLVGVAWGTLKMLDGAGRTVLLTECVEIDTDAGTGGYCVEVSQYPEGPVSSTRSYLEIAHLVDGEPLSYRFVAAYPFTARPGSALDIDFSQVDEQITVTDEHGVQVVYPFARYGPLR